MRRLFPAVFLFVLTLPLFAQAPGALPAANAAASVRDLPVRKVVLYKNGVGYFEHSGAVLATRRSPSISPHRS